RITHLALDRRGELPKPGKGSFQPISSQRTRLPLRPREVLGRWGRRHDDVERTRTRGQARPYLLVQLVRSEGLVRDHEVPSHRMPSRLELLPVPTAPARGARAGWGGDVEPGHALPVGLARTLVAHEQVEGQAAICDLRAAVGSRDRTELARAD